IIILRAFEILLVIEAITDDFGLIGNFIVNVAKFVVSVALIKTRILQRDDADSIEVLEGFVESIAVRLSGPTLLFFSQGREFLVDHSNNFDCIQFSRLVHFFPKYFDDSLSRFKSTAHFLTNLAPDFLGHRQFSRLSALFWTDNGITNEHAT